MGFFRKPKPDGKTLWEIVGTPNSVSVVGSPAHQAHVADLVERAEQSGGFTKVAAKIEMERLQKFAEHETRREALEELTPVVYEAMPDKSVNYKEKVIDVVAGARMELQKQRQKVELFPTKGNRKSLADMIGKLTLGGEAMPIFMLEVASGRLTVPIVTKAGLVVEAGPTIDQRMHAHEWLADRYFGKAPEKHVITPGSSEEQKLEELSDEQLAAVQAGAAILTLKKG